jgi:hypothetical protein
LKVVQDDETRPLSDGKPQALFLIAVLRRNAKWPCLSGGPARRARVGAMFDPAAPIALLNLLFAFLLRPFQPRSWRALERMEQVLADALRATLVDAGMTVPDLSNAKLIAWFNAHGPCSDQAACAERAAQRVTRFARRGVSAGDNEQHRGREAERMWRLFAGRNALKGRNVGAAAHPCRRWQPSPQRERDLRRSRAPPVAMALVSLFEKSRRAVASVGAGACSAALGRLGEAEAQWLHHPGHP